MHLCCHREKAKGLCMKCQGSCLKAHLHLVGLGVGAPWSSALGGSSGHWGQAAEDGVPKEADTTNRNAALPLLLAVISCSCRGRAPAQTCFLLSKPCAYLSSLPASRVEFWSSISSCHQNTLQKLPRGLYLSKLFVCMRHMCWYCDSSIHFTVTFSSTIMCSGIFLVPVNVSHLWNHHFTEH